MRKILIIVTLLLTSISFAGANNNPLSDEYDQGKLKSFISHLIYEGDYYRAYSELLRLQSYYPNSFTTLNFRVTKNYLLFKGERYSEIINDNKILLKKDTVNGIFIFDSYLNSLNFQASYKSVSNLNTSNIQFLEKIYGKRKFIASLLMEKYADAAQYIKDSDSVDENKYSELLYYTRNEYRKYKSPIVASILGIIPGAGYIYAGNTLTGVVSFLLISLNAVATYFAFNSGNQTVGVIIGSIGAFFYTGSIVGSYLSAKRYNHNLSHSLSEHLIDELHLQDDREYIHDTYGIGSNKRK